MQEVKEKEEEVFEIPDELKEEIINIMNDCPNIEKVSVGQSFNKSVEASLIDE